MKIDKYGCLTKVKEEDLLILQKNPEKFWEGVRIIGEYAFLNCKNLTSITIPEGVTMIDACAFRDCTNLASVTISEGLRRIGRLAFSDCKDLNSITIPSSVTSISDFAFNCSGLTSITIPTEVKYIGRGVFEDCKNLEKVKFEKKSQLERRFCEALEGFDFDSFEINGDEVSFMRNIQSSKYNHERDIT